MKHRLQQNAGRFLILSYHHQIPLMRNHWRMETFIVVQIFSKLIEVLLIQASSLAFLQKQNRWWEGDPLVCHKIYHYQWRVFFDDDFFVKKVLYIVFLSKDFFASVLDTRFLQAQESWKLLEFYLIPPPPPPPHPPTLKLIIRIFEISKNPGKVAAIAHRSWNFIKFLFSFLCFLFFPPTASHFAYFVWCAQYRLPLWLFWQTWLWTLFSCLRAVLCRPQSWREYIKWEKLGYRLEHNRPRKSQ